MNTIEIILRGFAAGLGLSIGLGTVFFALIQTSIKSGYKSGFIIAAGVIVCDMLFITFALVGTSFLDRVDLKGLWIQLSAVSLLLLLGIYTLFHSKQSLITKAEASTVSFGKVVYFFSKGFLLNALNPANFFAWAAISTYTIGSMGYTLDKNILFFSFSLMAIFIVECLISFGAHKIKDKLTDKIVTWINRASGIIYILVAVILIIDLVVN